MIRVAFRALFFLPSLYFSCCFASLETPMGVVPNQYEVQRSNGLKALIRPGSYGEQYSCSITVFGDRPNRITSMATGSFSSSLMNHLATHLYSSTILPATQLTTSDIAMALFILPWAHQFDSSIPAATNNLLPAGVSVSDEHVTLSLSSPIDGLVQNNVQISISIDASTDVVSVTFNPGTLEDSYVGASQTFSFHRTETSDSKIRRKQKATKNGGNSHCGCFGRLGHCVHRLLSRREATAGEQAHLLGKSARTVTNLAAFLIGLYMVGKVSTPQI